MLENSVSFFLKPKLSSLQNILAIYNKYVYEALRNLFLFKFMFVECWERGRISIKKQICFAQNRTNNIIPLPASALPERMFAVLFMLYCAEIYYISTI